MSTEVSSWKRRKLVPADSQPPRRVLHVVRVRSRGAHVRVEVWQAPCRLGHLWALSPDQCRQGGRKAGRWAGVSLARRWRAAPEVQGAELAAEQAHA